jgi:hypothetical protein
MNFSLNVVRSLDRQSGGTCKTFKANQGKAEVIRDGSGVRLQHSVAMRRRIARWNLSN